MMTVNELLQALRGLISHQAEKDKLLENAIKRIEMLEELLQNIIDDRRKERRK